MKKNIKILIVMTIVVFTLILSVLADSVVVRDGTINASGTGNNYFRGRVGIGITNPNELIEVRSLSGNSVIRISALSADYAAVDFNSTNSNTHWGIGRDSQGRFYIAQSGVMNALIIENNTAGSNRIYINKDGNVGIGTTSPSAKMHVYGDSYPAATIESSNSYGSILRLNASGTGGHTFQIQATASGAGEGAAKLDFDDLNGAASIMTLNGASGNVGIGTTGPWARLSVTGTSSGVNDVGIFQVTTGTGANTDNKLLLGVNDLGYSWIQAVKPGDDLKSLALNPNGGNVGIGTTNPTSKLQVVGGAINASGGLIIETRTSDPVSPATGQIWLRTDI